MIGSDGLDLLDDDLVIHQQIEGPIRVLVVELLCRIIGFELKHDTVVPSELGLEDAGAFYEFFLVLEVLESLLHVQAVWNTDDGEDLARQLVVTED